LGGETLQAIDDWGEENNINDDITPNDTITEDIWLRIQSDCDELAKQPSGLVNDVRSEAWKGRRNEEKTRSARSTL